MNRRAPLPLELHRDAQRALALVKAGASRGRLRGKDLLRPAHGVLLARESDLDLENLPGRCRSLLPILRPGQFFSRRTAAALWGIPVPSPPAGRVEVGAFHPGRAPRRPEILGHRVRAGRLRRAEIAGLPTPAVADIWCLLSTVVGLDDLVVAGDHILTPQRRFDGRGGRDPALATPEELAAAVRRHRGGTGAPLRDAALPLLRWPVDSPPETRTRLIIVRAGMPEPTVNCPVPVFGGTLHADLGYPELKIAIEHEGEYHFRGGLEQSRRDVERWEAMTEAGWRVLRLTALDLRDPRPFLRRLHSAVEGRRLAGAVEWNPGRS